MSMKENSGFMNKDRKLVVYIAMSLDGYIAKPNDDLSFLSHVEKPGEDYGYQNFISTIDVVLMGRKTYDWITQQCEFPHKDKKTYVITKSPRSSKETIEFYNGDLPELVKTLKSQPGKNIYCDGGASIIQQLLKHKLIDEMTISIIPILLGAGKKLFSELIPEELLKCVSAKSFDTGLVQVHYKLFRR